MRSPQPGKITLPHISLAPIFVAAGLLLLVISVLRSIGVAVAVSNDAQNAAAVVHYFHPAEITESDLLVGYLDQETGLRGYVLTGFDSFLSPYIQGNQKVIADYKTLDASLHPYPKLLKQLDIVQSYGRAWQLAATLHEIVPSLEETGLRSAVLASISADDAQFNRLRSEIAQLSSMTIHYDESARDVETSALLKLRTAVIVSGALSVLVLMALGALFWFLLIRPMRKLESSATVVSAGHLSNEVRVDGVHEIVSLSRSIEAMRLGILRETDIRRRASLIEVQFRERREIAEAVHDNPLQLLAAAKIRLQMRFSTAPEDEAISVAISLIDKSAAWMRNMISSLYPSGLARADFAEALTEHIASLELGSRTQILTRLDLVSFDQRDMRSEPAILLAFRCIQEFSANAVKAATAGSILISAVSGEDHIRITAANLINESDSHELFAMAEKLSLEAQRRHPRTGHLGIPLLLDSIEAVGGSFTIRIASCEEIDLEGQESVIYRTDSTYLLPPHRDLSQSGNLEVLAEWVYQMTLLNTVETDPQALIMEAVIPYLGSPIS